MEIKMFKLEKTDGTWVVVGGIFTVPGTDYIVELVNFNEVELGYKDGKYEAVCASKLVPHSKALDVHLLRNILESDSFFMTNYDTCSRGSFENSINLINIKSLAEGERSLKGKTLNGSSAMAGVFCLEFIIHRNKNNTYFERNFKKKTKIVSKGEFLEESKIKLEDFDGLCSDLNTLKEMGLRTESDALLGDTIFAMDGKVVKIDLNAKTWKGINVDQKEAEGAISRVKLMCGVFRSKLAIEHDKAEGFRIMKEAASDEN